MTLERWQGGEEGVGALEKVPEERRVYLDQACTKPDLRREVESLIAAHEQGDSNFMEQPALGIGEGFKIAVKLGRT